MNHCKFQQQSNSGDTEEIINSRAADSHFHKANLFGEQRFDVLNEFEQTQRTSHQTLVWSAIHLPASTTKRPPVKFITWNNPHPRQKQHKNLISRERAPKKDVACRFRAVSPLSFFPFQFGSRYLVIYLWRCCDLPVKKSLSRRRLSLAFTFESRLIFHCGQAHRWQKKSSPRELRDIHPRTQVRGEALSIHYTPRVCHPPSNSSCRPAGCGLERCTHRHIEANIDAVSAGWVNLPALARRGQFWARFYDTRMTRRTASGSNFSVTIALTQTNLCNSHNAVFEMFSFCAGGDPLDWI